MNKKTTNGKIRYESGFGYRLYGDYKIFINIFPEKEIKSKRMVLSTDGYLLIKDTYGWDGATGVAYDSKNFMRGSLVHDALYQLMREELISSKERKKADKLLVKICKEDGMSYFRAKYVYYGVRVFGGFAVNPKNRRKVLSAP